MRSPESQLGLGEGGAWQQRRAGGWAPKPGSARAVVCEANRHQALFPGLLLLLPKPWLGQPTVGPFHLPSQVFHLHSIHRGGAQPSVPALPSLPLGLSTSPTFLIICPGLLACTHPPTPQLHHPALEAHSGQGWAVWEVFVGGATPGGCRGPSAPRGVVSPGSPGS